MKNVLLLIAILASSVLNAQTLPSYVPTNGLVGYWPFNGDADDESGNGLNGTVYGASLTTDRNGNSNNAYDFNGSSYIEVANNTALNFSSSHSFSVWVRITGTNTWQHFITRNDGNSYPQLLGQFALRRGNGGSIEFYSSPSGNIFHTSNTLNSSNPQWHHIAAVVDVSALKSYLYLDGVKIDSNTLAAPLNYNNNNGKLWIGVENPIVSLPSGPQYFQGKLDGIGIWNRALSQSEILGLFNECQDSLIAQPSSNTFQTIPGTAHFTTAHSDTSATYQWQLNNGTGWTNLSDFGIYSGTTSDSLNLTGITTSLNNNSYRCIIDACTMDTTDVAILTVVDNIGVDESKSNITVSPNPTRGILSIDVRSTTEYKVYNLSGQIVAKGKTEGQIDITNLPTGSYQLIITNEDGRSVHTIQKI